MFFSFFKELYPKHISWRSALLEISLENWDLSTEDKYRSTDQRERLARTDCLMAHSRQRNKTIKRKKKKKLGFAGKPPTASTKTNSAPLS